MGLIPISAAVGVAFEGAQLIDVIAWFAPGAGPRLPTPISLRPSRFSLATSPGMAGCSSRRSGRGRELSGLALFGEHSPAYDLVYTLSKFRIKGCELPSPRRADFLTKMTERLRRSGHPAALPALIGLTHGVFRLVDGGADALRRYAPDAEHAFVDRFLARPATGEGCAAPLPLTAPPAGVFRACYRRGEELGRVGGADDLRAILRSLDGTSADLRLAALLGLGHGFFHSLHAADSLDSELAVLHEVPSLTH